MEPPSSARAILLFRTTTLVICSFLLLALVHLVVFPNDLELQEEVFASSSSSPCSSSNGATTSGGQLAAAATQPQPVDVRVFLGVLTMPGMYERRAHLRLAYSLQPRPVRAVVDVHYVFCNLDKEEDRVLVAMEIIAHGDILVVNCTETMDAAKTYAYFSAVARLFAGDDERYDFVGKTDDDTHYRLAALADALRDKPRDSMYHGLLNPCHTTLEWQYMSGMGYVVSWDMAEWIATTDETIRNDQGWEDEVFGRWIRKAGKLKNVYGEEPRMYDYWDREMPTEVNCFRHEHVADTVAVHKLKDRLKWARTLYFFNATKGLKPSKMYDVDRLNSNMYRV
ncbi:hypothetical protein EJB05_00262, partial [Eragrostis curvula]